MKTSKNPLIPLQIRVMLILGIVLSACFILGRGIGITSSKAQAPQQESTDLSPGQQRQLENRIPSHLPIKIKVKNLNSSRWVDDLEIEVTNTSTKPIYFLLFYVAFPEVKAPSGDPISFTMRYGRI